MSDEKTDMLMGDRYPLNSGRLSCMDPAHSSVFETTNYHDHYVLCETNNWKKDQYEATNIQVVVQGKADKCAIFLIDD